VGRREVTVIDTFTCTVNGRATQLEIEPWELLIDVLRERLDLTGTKRSCDVQVCGSCTVLLDGEAVSSCTTLAVEAEGSEVTTVEGFARDGELSPVQEAFVAANALQCGFCTPGFVTSCHAMLAERPDVDDEGIAHYLSGNVCRCTGYTTILAAARDARERARG
jgi:carbon-monoxide dehydrogenase small subunit